MQDDDNGYSVIETMMALTLLAVTMAAMSPFFVRSFLDVARQRGDQAAIELANSAVEQVRALKGSSLLTGRGLVKTRAQWVAGYNSKTAMSSYLGVLPGLTAPTGVNQRLTMRLATDPMITDTASQLGDDAAVSTRTQKITEQNTTYSRDVFIGECNVYLVNLPGYLARTAACVNPDVVTPPSDSTKVLQFFRAVVLITWPDKSCAAGLCSHISSTLISRAPEPMFDFNRPSPLIPDQTIITYAGEESTYQLDSDHGQLPNRWTLASGTLPAGFTLTPGGLITTNVPTPRTGTIAFRVTDAKGRSIDRTLTYKVVTGPKVTTTLPVRSYLLTPMTLELTATDGAVPYTYGVTGLPPGLKLDLAASDTTTGKIVISGTPTTAGPFDVTVSAVDDGGKTGTLKYTHTIFNSLQLQPIADRTVTVATAFSANATAVGGITPYTYSAVGLPTGVTINATTGAMSGAPTISGRYLPSITVKDAMNGTFSTSFVLTVNPLAGGLAFTPPGDQASAVGDKVDLAIESNAGLLGLKPTYSATGAPPGVSFNPAQGKFTGKPTTPGTYTVTVTGTNVLPPQTSVTTFVWTVT